MSPVLITLLMFGSMLLFIFLGYPIAFVIGGIAVLAAFFLWGPHSVALVGYTVLDQWSSIDLMALPLFILLANLLQRSGMGDDLYELMYRWMGGLKGGLAIGTVIISTIFAAISGVTAAAIVSMALVALPSMFKRNYDKDMVLGGIVVGGALGILIPPSVLMILYAFIADLSVGKLWFAGFLPGFLCSVLFIAYIAIRCYLNPKLGPVLPPAERATWREKLTSLKNVISPLAIVLLILLSIYTGVATPTEAAVVGLFFMFIAVGIRHKLTWAVVKGSLYGTLTLSAMCFWLVLACTNFNAVYVGMGARKLLEGFILGLQLYPVFIIVVMMAILLIMGMLMDITAIILICVPIFAPVAEALGFNPIWFGIIFIMTLQIATASPPYGFSLFLMRTVVPPGITIRDIYRSVFPFLGLQTLALFLVVFVPQIALWIPSLMR